MHKATCSECGKDCEIPFKPTGDRPVFCSNCFDKQGGGNGGSKRFGGDRRERPRFEDRDRGGMHDAVCVKCGEKCQVPFKPTPGKQVFCDNCFDRNGGSAKSSVDYSSEFKALNEKLDKLISLLSPAQKVVEKKNDNEVKEVKETKKNVKAKPLVKKAVTKKKK